MLGLAGWAPQAWPLAWLGVAGTAWALASERSTLGAVAGIVLGGLLTRVLWLAWSPAMAAAMFPGQPELELGVSVGFVVVAAAPVVGLLSLLAFSFRRRPGWVWVWLPLAWVLGERLQARWSSVATDWLFTQVDVPPIMSALGTLGLEATTLLCLFVAAGLGESLALGRWRRLLPVAAAAAFLVIVPERSVIQSDVLARLGAVHMPTLDQVPGVDQVDAELDVVIWPEVSFAAQPPAQEGGDQGLRLDAAPGGPTTWHVVGVRSPSRYGRQNMALAVAPDGRITQARAKAVLLPVVERRFLGFGVEGNVPGEASPVLDVGGIQLITLICGELLHRELVAAGVGAGGQVLVVMAGDRYQGGSDLADWQVLAHLRLRAVEYGVPAVYASLGHVATFVSARGEVLARSVPGAGPGVLTWSPQRGGRDLQPKFTPSVTVLYSAATPSLRPDCTPGRCDYRTLERLSCPEAPASVVVVSAHGDGRRVAGLDAATLAERVACFAPDLVVLDVCYGASTPILAALAARTDALVVAVPAFLAGRGFRYGPAFYAAPTMADRAAAIQTVPPSPLYIGHPDLRALRAAETEVAGTDGDTLRPRVRSWTPTLVSARLPSGQDVLVPTDWRRIGHPPLER